MEEKCLLIIIMIFLSSISAQKCKKPKVQRFVFCGPVVRISSGQCGGLHPGQAVPVPRAGLHLGQQEGRGLGPVPCSVSCIPAICSVVCSSVALGAAAACIMERCMKSGQALNTTLMAVSRLFGTWIALRFVTMSLSGQFDLRDERRVGRGLGGVPGGHGGLRQRGAGPHQGEGGQQQPQAGPAPSLHQL